MWENIRSVVLMLILAAGVYGIAKLVVRSGIGRPAPKPEGYVAPIRHCLSCGEDSQAAPGAQRNNTTVEVVLWVCMLWPVALVYSVWRRIGAGAKPVCPACNATTLVPVTSPAAQASKRRLAA